jgi:hypothetical protein
MLPILPCRGARRLPGGPLGYHPGARREPSPQASSVTLDERTGGERQGDERVHSSGEEMFMRLFRYAVLAALLAVPIMVAAAPATYAADSAGGAHTSGEAHASGGAHAFAMPSTATPGSRVTFSVACASLTAGGATLFGSTLGLPERIPMTHQNANSDYTISVDLPGDIAAGSYRPDIDCSDGSSAGAALTVTAFPSGGGAATGDGTTSTTSNGTLALCGLALIGVGALAGGFALRRRGARPRS